MTRMLVRATNCARMKQIHNMKEARAFLSGGVYVNAEARLMMNLWKKFQLVSKLVMATKTKQCRTSKQSRIWIIVYSLRVEESRRSTKPFIPPGTRQEALE